MQAENAPGTMGIAHSLITPFGGSTAGSEDYQISPPFSFSNNQFTTTDSGGSTENKDRPLALGYLSEMEYSLLDQSPYLQESVDATKSQSPIQEDTIPEPRILSGKRIREMKNQDASRENVATEIWPHKSANQTSIYRNPPMGQERPSASRSRVENSRPRPRVKRP